MTKTTEELKRDMYKAMSDAKLWGCTTMGAEASLTEFENRLEDYLEALRQEAESLKRQGSIALDAYAHQQQLTMQARAEADSNRNKLQAFEFANKSAGEFLIEARAKVRAQRQSIGQLKNERDNAQHALKVKESKLQKALQELSELRKVVGGTSAQSYSENVSQIKCEAKSSVLREVSESAPTFPIVCHAEFDDYIRTTCSACNRVTEAWK